MQEAAFPGWSRHINMIPTREGPDEQQRGTMKQDSLIDTDELQAFQAVISRKSFSEAADFLGVAQSTISQRIARLEKRAGRQLIRRTTRSVEITPEGESMLIYANAILSIAEDARRRLSHPPIAGVLKVGIEDEFATTNLHRILSIFHSQHPHFEIQFLTGRNEYLHDSLHMRDTDIILGKCHSGDHGGDLIWREDIIWVGRPDMEPVRASETLPLITYLGPSLTRDLVEQALLESQRPWRLVAQGSNLLGLLAAAEAGLGVMAIGRNFMTSNLQQLPQGWSLPELGTLDYVIQRRTGTSDPAIHVFIEVLRGFVSQFAERGSADPAELDRQDLPGQA